VIQELKRWLLYIHEDGRTRPLVEKIEDDRFELLTAGSCRFDKMILKIRRISEKIIENCMFTISSNLRSGVTFNMK